MTEVKTNEVTIGVLLMVDTCLPLKEQRLYPEKKNLNVSTHHNSRFEIR